MESSAARDPASMFNRSLPSFLTGASSSSSSQPTGTQGQPSTARPPAESKTGTVRPASSSGSIQSPVNQGTIRPRPRLGSNTSAPPPPGQGSYTPTPPSPAIPASGTGSDAPGAQDSITLGQLRANGPPPPPKQKVSSLLQIQISDSVSKLTRY